MMVVDAVEEDGNGGEILRAIRSWLASDEYRRHVRAGTWTRIPGPYQGAGPIILGRIRVVNCLHKGIMYVVVIAPDTTAQGDYS
jgi:hypothetical protein